MATALEIETDSFELRCRRHPGVRRFSTNQAGSCAVRSLCQSYPHSLEALDLSTASLTPSLAALRLHILSCLADIEARLSLFDSPFTYDTLKVPPGPMMEEARVWARDGLEILQSIRNDVSSHLPELSMDSVKSHMPDVPGLDNVRAHLPDMPTSVRSRFPEFDLQDMRVRIDDIRSRIADIDFHRPLSYVHTLSEHLQSLQTHLSSMEIPHSLYSPISPTAAALSDLYDKVISSDLISEISSDIREGEDMIEKAASQIACAVKQSLNGSRLIQYVDLPDQWRNNPFVQHGYRFIPLQEWPRLILSLFALHNETLNIHTHLIPFVAWLITLSLFSNDADPPVIAFTAFALLCLFSSALWHTMAGCAHPKGMELCARIDYVGIGWLISASVGTVVHYGFQCEPTLCDIFLTLCLTMGIAGSVLPFTEWFNKSDYRNYRILFFLFLAFTSLAPLGALAHLHSTMTMLNFIRPIAPSLLSYVAGLVFYTTHFPECYLHARWAHSHVLDRFGCGSHAIWHVFIVLAIAQHKAAMTVLKHGIGAGCQA